MTAREDLAIRAASQGHDLSTSTTPTGKELARRLSARHIYQFKTVAEGAAGSTIGEEPVVVCPASQFPNGAKLVEISFRSDTAITESTAVFATDTFTVRDSDGVNNLTAATLKTDTVANGGIGTTVAQKRYVATLVSTPANLTIPADGCLTLTRAKTATGTQLPDCHYQVIVEAL
jgi:hypothetical protein